MAERAFVVLSTLLLLAAGCRGVLGINAVRGELDAGEPSNDAGRSAAGSGNSDAGHAGGDDGGSDEPEEAGKGGKAGRAASLAGAGGAAGAGAGGMPMAGMSGMSGAGASGMSGAGAGGAGAGAAGGGSGGASGQGGGGTGGIVMSGGGSGGGPACSPPPAACQGEDDGNVCQSDTAYVQCSTDVSGCVVATPASCDVRKPCRGDPGEAECTCEDDPSNNQCPVNARNGSRCVGSAVYRCGADSLGCPRFMQTACASGVCRGTYPDAACVDEVKVGWPTEFSSMQEHPSGALAGSKIEIQASAQLLRIGIITKAGGTHGLLALYSDQNGKPHTRLAATSNNLLVTGINEFTVPLPPSPVILSPGTYWVMTSFDASTQVAHSMATEPLAYVAYVHGTPLPNTLNSMDVAVLEDSGFEPNFYIVVLPQ